MMPMPDWLLHPGLLLVLAAALLPLAPARARPWVAIVAPLAALALLWSLPAGTAAAARWMGYELAPLRVDALARLFATVFCLMACAGAVFAYSRGSRVEASAALLYSGSAVGAVLAGDLVTLFVCWELMAIGSTLVIWSAATPAAWAASRRYALMHLFGGVVLLAGVAGQVATTGDAAFAAMRPESAAQWLILAGFLINAGAPPVSAWLPDAYPEASWSGTVFLSAFTTKTAVYVLLRGFPGTELLVWIGLAMVFYGIVYALLENDMRRILAYSIVNQVGFMIAGIGIGTQMAINGAAAHAFTHIIYKGLLLMSAGAVLHATGRRKCSELGGLFHSMPWTTWCGIVGALSISAFPLTSGFVSKSMISQAAADAHLAWVWYALAAASAGVFLHAGIKFPWFVFFQRDSGLRPPEAPLSMRLAMLAFAALCLGIGVWPQALYGLLPHRVEYVPYTAAHVLTQTQLLLFSGLAFFLLLPWLKRTPTITLDTDWLWRRLPRAPAIHAFAAFVGLGGALDRAVRRVRDALLSWGGSARVAGAWRARSTGAMTLWAMLLLLGYLVAYYLV
jgi:multicomponent Na+:H+ antiporter subunit D